MALGSLIELKFDKHLGIILLKRSKEGLEIAGVLKKIKSVL